MAQQLHDEIRRELRVEQQDQSPAQQLHKEINQGASREQSIEVQQLYLVHHEQEYIQKLAKSKFGT
jgi:ribonuclease BN (tRNA processing enzyme)